MRIHASLLAFSFIGFVACGSDTNDEVDNIGSDAAPQKDAGTSTDEKDAGPPKEGGTGGEVVCSAVALSAAEVDTRQMYSSGLVLCDGSANIRVETCVQWEQSGGFEDIQCRSSTQSAVESLSVDYLSSCGLNTSLNFRTRVNAEVNGTAHDEVLSDIVKCE